MKAQLTPTSNFILPLLYALDRVGGSGKKIDIYRMLEKQMDLSPADMELTKSGWHWYHIHVNYLVGRMREAGLLELGAGDNSLLCWLLGTPVLRIDLLYTMEQAFLPT